MNQREDQRRHPEQHGGCQQQAPHQVRQHAAIVPACGPARKDGEGYADAVARDLHEARARGVTGVPFFTIDGRYGISGAQATEVFTRALEVAASSTPGPDHQPGNEKTDA
jgi:hypothetical protein